MNEERHICIIASGQPLTLPYLLRGVASYARLQATWSQSLVLSDTPDLAGHVASMEPDGIILATANVERARTLAALDRPTVSLCRGVPAELAVAVWPDDAAIGATGAQHLLAQGFGEFAFCGLDAEWSRQRKAAFERALHEAGGTCHTLTLSATPTHGPLDPADERRLEQWLQEMVNPVAIMCSNDTLAAGLAGLCRRMGLNVPADVALLGADNVEIWCEFSTPPLSSVDPNLVRVGHDGSELLDALMDGTQTGPGPMLVQPLGVKPRESTAVMAPEDELVSRALDYIRDHIDRPIGVEDILDELVTSRSSLQRRFREALGRSPGEEIRRMRLERVRDLVLNSDMPLAEIAEASGFEYISHLCKAFKSAYGMSPKKYRRHHRGYSSALIPLSEVDPEALATYQAMNEAAGEPED